MLLFGARSPGELRYFGPLQKLPREFIDNNLAFSPRRAVLTAAR
jgi:benzoyl-CoA 2,3-epoxidase subunit A